MKLITVFTPTYNRAETLRRCYDSLVTQTSYNFIWQIIDDGSTDGTEKLVRQFIQEKKIEIEYYKKDNGGKCSAINMSLDYTNTALWVCLDSDDYFFRNAIEIYERLYPLVRDDSEVCGLFSLRSNIDGTPMNGVGIPLRIKKDTQFNLRYKYHIKPEYVQVYKSSVIKGYRYPTFEGEKFVPLSFVQDQIDQKYKFIIFHEPTMVCKYQKDGITQNHCKLVKKNPRGYLAFRRQQIEIAPNILFMIKACVTYDTAGILCGDVVDALRKSPCKIMTILTLPMGYLDYYLRYRKT